ncbi:hypothetical protein JRO89_XS07G0281100 [Xanthoceras sorbifolium]|uniref:Uncharacterized protein n=1 Tax=Xanthoceras sorbifolium TaxID=99658 RepID=A0ABQ8HVG2_9ROSI|nr:hypothetical protein JRO89_XS07G0281100 [Xanthoceras sorbifolium]
MVPYECCANSGTVYGRCFKFRGYLTVRGDRVYKDGISIDLDHVVLGYRGCSNVKLLEDDSATCSVKFETPDEGQNCNVKCCGVCPVYADREIIQPGIYVGKFGSTNQFSGETMVEGHIEKMEHHRKRKSAHFINNKVSLLHLTLLKGVDVLHCYCWSFLVCLFGGLCVFGLLGLLVLHLSTRCEIYLSYHVQNMRVDLLW